MIPHSITCETPFHLTSSTEVIILVEVEELSWSMAHPLPKEENNRAIREKIDLLEEKRTFVAFNCAIIKQATTFRYNRHVRPRELQMEDFVLRKVNITGKNA